MVQDIVSVLIVHLLHVLELPSETVHQPIKKFISTQNVNYVILIYIVWPPHPLHLIRGKKVNQNGR